MIASLRTSTLVALCLSFLLLFAGADAKKAAPKKEPKDAIKYGESFWIQNAGHYRGFLINATKKKKKSKNSDHPALKNPFESNYDHSEWKIMKPSSKGGTTSGGGCVKFGDKVILRTVKDIKRDYIRIDAKDSNDAQSREWPSNTNDHKYFHWVIRSNPGETGDPAVTSDDPATGMCILDFSKVYIMPYAHKNRWMHDNNCEDINSASKQKPEEQAKFVYILRKELGLGKVEEGIECLPTTSTGKWRYLATASGGDYTVTYTAGNTRTKSTDKTMSTNWDVSVTATVTANFGFMGNGGSASLSTTASYGGSQSKTVSDSLANNEDVSQATTFYDKGIVWQYVIEMADLCVPNWDVTTKEVMMTPSMGEEPCCLPGYFADIENPHGACIGDSPCVCSKEVCAGHKKAKEEAEAAEAAAAAEEESESEDESEDEEDSYDLVRSFKPGSTKTKVTKRDYRSSGEDDYEYYDDDNSGYDYNDDFGFYDDDYSFGSFGGYGGGGGYGGYGGGGGYGGHGGGGGYYGGHGGGAAAPMPGVTAPGLSYNGNQPLISLNINQANTNNNAFPTAPEGGNAGDGGAPPAAGYGDDYVPEDGMDFGDDDDDANTDDYLDVVLDALVGLTDEEDDREDGRKLRGSNQA